MKLIIKKIKLSKQISPMFLWISVVVFLLSTSIFFYIGGAQEHSLRIFMQEQRDRAVKERIEIQEKITEINEAKRRVEEELIFKKSKVHILEVELDQTMREMKSTLDELQKEISLRREAENHLVIALEGKRDLEEKLREFTVEQKAIELGEIVVTSRPPLIGKVLVVNKEHQFIVVNLGLQEGLNLGDVLSVYHDSGEFLGMVKVDRIEEKTSACAALSKEQMEKFKENDIVERP